MHGHVYISALCALSKFPRCLILQQQTLSTDAGNFRAFKVLIAAEYNEIPINVPEFTMLKDNVTDEFRRKSPLGKVPVLDTPQGKKTDPMSPKTWTYF